ncbi:beta-class phenol-soluble modulin, partial [Prevotella sp. OH937_COT-195]
VITLYVRRFIFMEHISKLGEAIVNTVSAGQSGDGAELAKSIVNIVTNGAGLAGDIAKAFGLM